MPNANFLQGAINCHYHNLSWQIRFSVMDGQAVEDHSADRDRWPTIISINNI